jgi:hypothetical protein
VLFERIKQWKSFSWSHISHIHRSLRRDRHASADSNASYLRQQADIEREHEIVERVLAARPIKSWKKLEIEIIEKGKKGIGDLSYLDSLPVFSEKAAKCLGKFLTDNGQLLPVVHGKDRRFLFNTIHVINALDRAKSKLDHEGRISSSDKHVFRPECLLGATVFKVPESRRMGFPYVTGDFIARVKESKLVGFSFDPVWSSGSLPRETYVAPKRLLDFDGLQQALHKTYKNTKYRSAGLPDFFLRKNNKERATAWLAKLEHMLQRRLPDSFRRAWRNYNLGKWEGLASFTPLHEIWKDNCETDCSWWGDEARPDHLLIVAHNDPYTILLHTKAGKVLAMDEDTPLDKLLLVGSDFEKFVLGLGTLEIYSQTGKSNRKLAKDIARWTGGSQKFWLELAECR